LENSDYNTIQNTDIYNNDYGAAIYIDSDYNTFDNVDVINNYGTGIQLYESNDNIITNSDISHNSGGIFIESSYYNQFTDLHVIGNTNWGLSFVSSIYNYISGCVIQEQGGEGVRLYGCNLINIMNSNISNNMGYGVEIDSSLNIYIYYSEIYNNYGGISTYEHATVGIIDSRITTAWGFGNDINIVEETTADDLGGAITTLNTTFDHHKIGFSMAYESMLTVLWYLHVRLVDRYMNPVPDTAIYIWNDYEGIENQVYYISDDGGWIHNIVCTDYIQDYSSTIDYNPYTLSCNIPGYGTFNKTITVDHTQTVYFILSPVDLIAQKLTYSTTKPVVDEDFYINCTIYNNNPDPVSNIDVKYTITHGFDLIYSTVLKVPIINAYSTAISSLDINFSQAEDYTIDVEVDVYNLIEEYNEGNNSILQTFTIYPKPVAVMDVSTTKIDVDKKVFFFGNDSRSYTGTIIRYIFDFGDGSPVTKSPLFTTDHTYTKKGYFLSSLMIEDEVGKFSDKVYIWIQVIEPEIPNQNPVANFTIEPATGSVRTGFKFISTSYCPDEGGEITNRIWNFGDGNTSNWISPVHHYTQDGVYTVSLLVWDDDNDISEYFNKTLIVSNLPPEPVLTASKYYANLKDAIEFDASLTTDPDDTLEELATVFLWDFGDGDTYSESPINFLDGAYDKRTLHSYSKPGTFNVTLRVFDDDGAMNQTMIQVTVNATGGGDPDSDGDDPVSWLEGNAQWAAVIISFLIAIILAIFMLMVYRKKSKKPKEEEEPEPEPSPSFTPEPEYDDLGPPEPSPAGSGDFKPTEFDVDAGAGLAPTDITPVSKRHRRKKKKGKAKKEKKKEEEPEVFKEDIDAEEEEEWDFEEAGVEEIEAKRAATVVEYPELGEEEEITLDDEVEDEVGKEPEMEEDIGEEIEPDFEEEPVPETEPEPELSIEEPVETELEEMPVEVEEVTEEVAVEPAFTTPMPAVDKPVKPTCRWCEREIEGKYIKGRRKKDPKTGDEYFVEGPFCSMNCANEYFK